MIKNVYFLLMLLGGLAFSMTSCEAFRPIQQSGSLPDYKEDRPSNRRTPDTRNEDLPNPVSDSDRSQLRKEIIRYASKFEGVKYKYAGSDPKTGFDCSGFTCYVMKKFNLDVGRTSSVQATRGRRIRKDDARAGDLIFFSKNGSRGKISHVGLVAANGGDGLSVIHCTTSRGVVKENISRSSYWTPKYRFVRQVVD